MNDIAHVSDKWRRLTHLRHNFVITVIIWILVLGSIIILFQIINDINAPELTMENIAIIQYILICIALTWSLLLFIILYKQHLMLKYTRDMRYMEIEISMDIIKDLIMQEILSRNKYELGIKKIDIFNIKYFSETSAYSITSDDEQIMIYFSNESIITQEKDKGATIIIGPWTSVNLNIIGYINSIIHDAMNDISKKPKPELKVYEQ